MRGARQRCPGDCGTHERLAPRDCRVDCEPSQLSSPKEVSETSQSAKRTRLDVLVVARGLAPSRERAQALILAGQVTVDGQRVTKAGAPVADAAAIALVLPDHPYVGRGGIKLAHALDTFAVAAHGRRALDVGASTGGFTDVLLQRGARDVIALDVGHGQLDWKLRNDPRVLVREGLNARRLTPGDLPHKVDVVSVDVSFISLRHILPTIPALLNEGGDVIVLVKPQFEAGRRQVGKGGIVSDSAVHEQVLASVAEAAGRSGFAKRAMTPSPITGRSGNREFFLHLNAISAERVSDELR